ncbi:hypothetical protein [Cryptosporangium sp. NPDC051539]|uniref:hypothetical protein n=1 Tax=Cryptosporangium sp. NPDC051539 TaxID=3363962 RepID=UPI00378A4AE8
MYRLFISYTHVVGGRLRADNCGITRALPVSSMDDIDSLQERIARDYPGRREIRVGSWQEFGPRPEDQLAAIVAGTLTPAPIELAP